MAEDSDPLGNPPDTGDADAYEIVEMEDGKRELTDAEVEDDKSYSWHSSDEEDDDWTSASSIEGVLNQRLVAKGLSKLGRTADGSSSCFIELKLSNLDLMDISILAKYDQLQVVHLPHNRISDVTLLGHMPFLLELDVSHNQISQVLAFTPPRNLVSANFAHNQITNIADLSTHHFLQTLVLDNNEIRFIEGLSECHRLQTLSLANNKITHIENLDNLPLHELCLKGNQIAEIENLETLLVLQKLDLSWNQIKSLKGLENHDLLETITVENNIVSDMAEIEHITRLPNLRVLDFQGNPIQNLENYRMEVLFNIQRLTRLDKQRASTQEKVAAWNLFKPPPEVIAAQDHVKNLMYQFMQPAKVLESTLPSLETPYPMLVLVGPNGSGSHRMAQRLAKDFSEYFRYAMPCTTAPPQIYENNIADSHLKYMDVEDFDKEVTGGKLLVSYAVHDHHFGFQLDSLEDCAVDGLACVTCLELEGVLSLKNSHHRPRYVLLLPLDPGEHERRLRERGCLTPDQIQFELERVGVYAQYNRERPGFFDRVIDTTNIRDSYKELGSTIMDYLGIGSDPARAESTASKRGAGVNRATSVRLVGSAYSAHSSADESPFIDRPEGESALASTSRAATYAGESAQTSVVASVATPQGSVELESLQRRTAAAKEVVGGRLGGNHSELFKVPMTAPQRGGSGTSQSSGSGTGGEAHQGALTPRFFSAPETRKDAEGFDVVVNTPDSSEFGEEQKRDSSLGRSINVSQASHMSRILPPIIKSAGSRLKGIHPPAVSINVYEASPPVKSGYGVSLPAIGGW